MRLLATKKIECTGTLRKNRLEYCEWVMAKYAEKYSFITYNDSTCGITTWRDNSDVTIGSNVLQANPGKYVKRYSASEKRKMDVSQPHMVGEYNKYMGGTNIMDWCINQYKPTIRKKKCFFPLFVFYMQASAYNGWILRKELPETNKNRLLQFLRNIVTAYIKHCGRQSVAKPSAFKVSKISSRVQDAVRFDGVSHFSGKKEKKTRCCICGKHIFLVWKKCDIALHKDCFEAFYT